MQRIRLTDNDGNLVGRADRPLDQLNRRHRCQPTSLGRSKDPCGPGVKQPTHSRGCLVQAAVDFLAVRPLRWCPVRDVREFRCRPGRVSYSLLDGARVK